MRVSKVTGREIKTNKGSSSKKLVLQLEISSPDDIQSVQLMQSAGENSSPPDGSRVIVVSIGTNGYKLAVGVDDGIEPEDINPGEKLLYSSDGGVIKAKLFFNRNGDLELNDGTDYAVQFSALKTEFEKLQNAWDTFASAYVPGGPTVQGTPATASASNSNIDNAKINTVRLP